MNAESQNVKYGGSWGIIPTYTLSKDLKALKKMIDIFKFPISWEPPLISICTLKVILASHIVHYLWRNPRENITVVSFVCWVQFVDYRTLQEINTTPGAPLPHRLWKMCYPQAQKTPHPTLLARVASAHSAEPASWVWRSAAGMYAASTGEIHTKGTQDISAPLLQFSVNGWLFQNKEVWKMISLINRKGFVTMG